MTSPSRSSAMPAHSAAAIPGCSARRLSISSGAILLPPREMMSLARPTRATVPSRGQPGKIAGLEIAVLERRVGQHRIIEIPEHAEWRADLQFTVGRDAEGDAVGRQPDRAETVGLSGGAKMEVARAGFGETIEIVDLSRREARHGLSQRRRQHFAAAPHRAKSRRD